jgi:hypothetical protein
VPHRLGEGVAVWQLGGDDGILSGSSDHTVRIWTRAGQPLTRK